MKKTILTAVLLFPFICCFAQVEESDSSRTMDEVTVRAFEQNRQLRSTITSVKIIEFLMRFGNPSKQIIEAVNAGVKWLQKVKIQGYDFVTVDAGALNEADPGRVFRKRCPLRDAL